MSKALIDQENENFDGFLQLLGFRIVDWEPGSAVIEVPLSERHLNRNKAVHGGVLMSVLDTTCGLSGTYCDVAGHIRRCVTIAINTQFVKPAGGEILRVEGCMTARTRKMFFAEGRVFSGSELVAVAQGTFRYILGGDTDEGVPRGDFQP